MFDISSKLMSEQEEISGLETIGWENHSWKDVSLIIDESFINLKRTKVYVFSDSESNKAWDKILGWITSSQSYRNFDRIDGEPTEFEWNIFTGSDTLQLSDQVKSLLSLYARRFGKWPWSFIGPGFEKSGTLSRKTVPKESGTIWRKRCCWNLLRADVQFSVLRLHCPEVNSKAKDVVNCRITLQPSRKQLRLFRINVSANQLSLYGAVAEMCEEYESLHERTERLVVMGQSIVLSAIKTSFFGEWWPSEWKFSIATKWRKNWKGFHKLIKWVNSVWMHDFWVLWRMGSISWRKTPEIWQNSTQWLVVNTLFQEKNQHHNRKDGSKETPKLDPCWKLQPVICTVNMESRLKFVFEQRRYWHLG